jgi:hypothetical protein
MGNQGQLKIDRRSFMEMRPTMIERVARLRQACTDHGPIGFAGGAAIARREPDNVFEGRGCDPAKNRFEA